MIGTPAGNPGQQVPGAEARQEPGRDQLSDHYYEAQQRQVQLRRQTQLCMALKLIAT